MRTHVEFRSAAIRSADAGTNEMPGRSLAFWLAENLPQHGFEVSKVIPEDWGWCVRLQNEAFPLWLGCGRYAEYPDGYLCFIKPSKPQIRRWLKRIQTQGIVQPLAANVDRLLRDRLDIYDVRWWDDDTAADR